MSEKRDQPLRVLHVGVANRGTWPLRAVAKMGEFASGALCDLSAPAIEEARKITGLSESACYQDLDKAIAEAEVDCVVVCTPTRFHVPMAEKAIAAGLPVLVEKGMAPDWASAQRLARFVRERDGIACVAQNYRYSGDERTVRRAIHDPTYAHHVGPVHMVTYSHQRVRPFPRTLDYPFASIWDMSCHHIDNLLDWLGPVRSVTAHCWRAPWSAYEHGNNTTAHWVFQNGTHVHYIHTHDAARGVLDIQVHGERGALFVGGSRPTFNLRPREQLKDGVPEPVEPEPGLGEAGVMRDFGRYIREGVEPGISVRNNLETMAACEMMVRSIQLERTVSRHELQDK